MLLIFIIMKKLTLLLLCTFSLLAVHAQTNVAAIDNILTRCSIRSFKQVPVEEGKIDTLLRAGMAAPTSRDMQPWHFVVISDSTSRNRFAATNPRHGDKIRKTPLIIIVCGDTTRMQPGGSRDFWVEDCSAASENILLAAHALGLGAVWTSVYPEMRKVKAFSQNLHLRGNLIPMSSIMIGYPDEPADVKDKWDVNKITFWKGE